MTMERSQAELGKAARIAALNATMVGMVRVYVHPVPVNASDIEANMYAGLLMAKKPKPKPRPGKPGC